MFSMQYLSAGTKLGRETELVLLKIIGRYQIRNWRSCPAVCQQFFLVFGCCVMCITQSNWRYGSLFMV